MGIQYVNFKMSCRTEVDVLKAKVRKTLIENKTLEDQIKKLNFRLQVSEDTRRNRSIEFEQEIKLERLAHHSKLNELIEQLEQKERTIAGLLLLQQPAALEKAIEAATKRKEQERENAEIDTVFAAPADDIARIEQEAESMDTANAQLNIHPVAVVAPFGLESVKNEQKAEPEPSFSTSERHQGYTLNELGSPIIIPVQISFIRIGHVHLRIRLIVV